MNQSETVPVSVNYAAGLCGLLGALLIFGAFSSFTDGRGISALVALALAVVYFGLSWGLRRSSRLAQVGSIVMGVLTVLLGLLMATTEVGLGIGIAAAGVLLILLVSATSGARRYFAGRRARLGAA